MKKVVSIIVALLLCASVSFAADFPERDITDVVVWGAGGGTDTCNRVVAAEMAKILGVNINVINKTGGVAGSIGMTYAFSQPSDGYTLCGLSESNVTAAVQEGWDQKMDVWDEHPPFDYSIHEHPSLFLLNNDFLLRFPFRADRSI